MVGVDDICPYGPLPHQKKALLPRSPSRLIPLRASSASASRPLSLSLVLPPPSLAATYPETAAAAAVTRDRERLVSIGESMDSDGTPPAASLSSEPDTSARTYSSSQDGSLPCEASTQEEGADSEGILGREDVVPKEGVGGGSTEVDEKALPDFDGEKVPLPTLDTPAMQEKDAVAEGVLDEGAAAGDDEYSSTSQLVNDTPPLPSSGEVSGSPGRATDAAGDMEGKLGDSEEKEVDSEAARASGGGFYLHPESEDGFSETEVEGKEEEEKLADGSSDEVEEFNRDGTFSERSVSEDGGKGAGVHDHPALGGAPPNSSTRMEKNNGAAVVIEDEILQGAAVGNNVDEETVSDAAVTASSEAEILQSCPGALNGIVDDEVLCDESGSENVLGDEDTEAIGSADELGARLLAVDVESEVNKKKSEDISGAIVDDDLDVACSVETGAQRSEPSVDKGINGKTEEEEAVNSSKNVGVEDIGGEKAQGVMAVSMDSGEPADSKQNPVVLAKSGNAEGDIASDEMPDVEQTSSERDGNCEDGKSKVDADKGVMASSREMGPIEQPGNKVALRENAPTGSVADSEHKDIDGSSEAAEDGKYMGQNEGGSEKDGVASDRSNVVILGSSDAAKDDVKVSEGHSSGFKRANEYSNDIDGQIHTDSDEEMLSDEEGDGKELFDSAALTALLKAAAGASSDSSATSSNQDATRIFSVDRPAGLGSFVPALKPAPPRTTKVNIFSPSELAGAGEPENEMGEEEKKLREKVDDIRVKFLRLVHRLGHSPEDRVAAQVLYRLGLAEGIRRGRQIGRAFSLENAKRKALQLEEDGKEPLNFSCNVLVLGKTGVGKSATINSIFGEEKVRTSAFDPATTTIRVITGVVDGVNVRVVDTPGLRSSVMEQSTNKRILSSIHKYTKKCPPDIVLYVDRLDTQTWDFNDLPLLRSIAETMGSSVWFNAIVALTHAASAPPDGPNGSPLSYEVFVDQRSRIVQHAIRQAAGDMRLMNPVALVENHPSCRRNREGQRVLPNGLSWRTQMLLLCYSSKILSEANSILKLQEPSSGKLFNFRVRSPPLPFLLSSLLQSRAHPKLATEQGGDGDSDIDLDDLSDLDQEQEEDEYDQLPPFKPLRKSQIGKLTKEQRNAYFDEYDYRVKLLQKKQWKEEIRRSKELRKRAQAGVDESGYNDMIDDIDQDGAPAAIPVPLPDMVLPPSFDCDNPAYRYRFLEPTSQLLVRPVLDSHGWDHDCGYDGVSVEESLAVLNKFPTSVSVQITKDKKEFNIHLDSCVSAKHGETGSTLAGFDIQSVGKQLAYILRSETKFKNLRKNNTAAGVSVTFLGENVATGLKVEDQLVVGKRLGIVASTGAVRAQGDTAFGANLEMRLRDKDFPVAQDLSTLGLSLMKWRRDLALGANLQSQFSVGRNSKMAVRVGLNNKLSGQITVRISTSEQLQLALLGIFPIAISVYRSLWSGESE